MFFFVLELHGSGVKCLRVIHLINLWFEETKTIPGYGRCLQTVRPQRKDGGAAGNKQGTCSSPLKSMQSRGADGA